MGMSTGGNKGGVQSEINVTPLIDVLLVLLIIFILVMPIMMKNEALEIPRKLDENIEIPDTPLGMLTLTVKADLSIEFTDGLSETPTVIQMTDVMRVLKPKLDAMASAGQVKVVFVDFEKTIPWREVVNTMDTIRAIATDEKHNEVKVALKVKDDATAPSATP